LRGVDGRCGFWREFCLYKKFFGCLMEATLLAIVVDVDVEPIEYSEDRSENTTFKPSIAQGEKEEKGEG
jgi:hypothetical protein